MPLTRMGICNGDVATDLHGRRAIRSGVSSVQKGCSVQNHSGAEKMTEVIAGNAMRSLAEVDDLVKDTSN